MLNFIDKLHDYSSRRGPEQCFARAPIRLLLTINQEFDRFRNALLKHSRYQSSDLHSIKDCSLSITSLL